MMTGGCLCRGVRFDIARVVGPFELCHCTRCRKVTGSAFAAQVGVRREDFRLVGGRDLITSYDAPILDRPPAYRTSFCRRCGSPVPNPDPECAWFELPAGLLDDDLPLRPDKHILIEHKAPWFEITDRLPQFDSAALKKLRSAAGSTQAATPAHPVVMPGGIPGGKPTGKPTGKPGGMPG